MFIGAVSISRPIFAPNLRFSLSVGGRRLGLAVSDPADGAAIRAAEIVCGRPLRSPLQSFDDIRRFWNCD